jgi:hypothetical protein
MASRVADEREQRRGLILGLTLAEVLLLLLFLLLLVLGSQIRHWHDLADAAQLRYEQLGQSMEELKPLQEALSRGGAADINSVQELITRFQNLQNAERELSALKKENDSLSTQSELVKSFGLVSDDKIRAVTSAVKRAREIDPSDPPALLKRALDVLDRLGPTTQPDQVRPLSQMVAASELDQKLSTIEADRDEIRRQRDNLMRVGNGLTYPSCWSTATGQTEYIFDVTLMDAGVLVRNSSPARASDKAWTMVGQFAREAVINENSFIGATKKLFEWSKTQNCRFYTIVRDATGATNKARYKHLQTMVQGNFYPFYPSPQRNIIGTPKPELTAPIAAPSGSDTYLQAVH